MRIEDYEKQQFVYADFAQTVADVVAATIRHAGGYRLQVVRARGKDVDSLRKKLNGLSLSASDAIEREIKDLSGCRAIFYTNGDVEKLMASGLVEANFEVHEARTHTPGIDLGAATRMYTANHYVVSLRPDRVALPEYARFAGMRCEIQLQTILNHSWAELEHDIIYKSPELPPSFGAEVLESIRKRLKDIATKHLLPAGYEFQKAAVDFDRLVRGKDLFDRGALAAIGLARNNNDRFDAIQSFADHVLPLYDEPSSVIADVLQALMEAADTAHRTDAIPIETPYGTFAGKTFEDVVELLVQVITRYRYLDIPRSLDAARFLRRLARTPGEREHPHTLALAIAKHDLEIWKAYGPVVQRMVVDYVAALRQEDLLGDWELLTELLEGVLDSEATASTFSAFSVALGRGAVVGSPELAAIRDDALAQLTRLFEGVDTKDKKNRIVSAMWHAAQPPYGPAPSRDLTKILMANAVTLIDFSRSILSADLELARKLEIRVHRAFGMFRAVRPELAEDADIKQLITRVGEATARFRAALEALPDFDAYKVLVGFDSIFPNAWENCVQDFEETEKYRTERADELLAKIDAGNVDSWLERLERFAQTDSNDAATFIQFAKFVEALAQQQPDLILARIDRINGKLGRFLFRFLAGLLQSHRATAATDRITQWLMHGERLDQVPWLLVASKGVPTELYRAVLDSAIAHEDAEAVRDVVRACALQFDQASPDASRQTSIFLDALRHMAERGDCSWTQMRGWFSWFNSKILQALDDAQARQVIDWIVPIPQLSREGDNIMASLGTGRPALALEVLDRRMTLARLGGIAGLVPIPNELHETTKALKQVPQDLLAAARRWFDAGEQSLEFSAKRILENVFDDFPPVLHAALDSLLKSDNRDDALFALEVLSAFEGQPAVLELAREAAGQWGHDGEVAGSIHVAITQEESGTVGVYGRARALQARKVLVEAWLADSREGVRKIAAEEIRYLDQRIAQETKLARDFLAKRRLDYNEDPMGDPPD